MTIETADAIRALAAALMEEVASRPGPDDATRADVAGPDAAGRTGVLATRYDAASDTSTWTMFDADGPTIRAGDELVRRAAALGVGLAATRLAPPDPRRLAVIGAGPLAGATTQVLRDLYDLDVRIYDPDRDRAEALARQTGGQRADGPQAALRGVDLVVVATRGRDPAIRDDWLGSDGLFVAAVGAVRATDRELDARTLARARFVCVDDREAARARAADLIEPVAHGVLEWLEVHELGELIRDELAGRGRPDDLTIYKAVGSARLPLLTSGS